MSWILWMSWDNDNLIFDQSTSTNFSSAWIKASHNEVHDLITEDRNNALLHMWLSAWLKYKLSFQVRKATGFNVVLTVLVWDRLWAHWMIMYGDHC